jgi:chemotaxis signal transduction protein
MAKKQIYQQKEALAVYFRDMLAEVQRAPADVSTVKSVRVPDTGLSQIGTRPPAPPPSQQPKTTSPYKLLLCKVGGIKLAIPVSALNNIVYWPSSGLHQLPHSHDWQLGLLEDRGQHLEVIDIRQLLQAPEPASPAYILLINQPRYGIVCDSISRIVDIEEDQINWRQERSQRPWFSGVIADSMHSIVDISALLTALKQGEMA